MWSARRGAGRRCTAGTSSGSRSNSRARALSAAAIAAVSGAVAQMTRREGRVWWRSTIAIRSPSGEMAGEPVADVSRWTSSPSARPRARSESSTAIALRVTSAVNRPYSSAGPAPKTPVKAGTKPRSARAVIRRQRLGSASSPSRSTSHSRYAEPVR